jgi:hypothetical protein
MSSKFRNTLLLKPTRRSGDKGAAVSGADIFNDAANGDSGSGGDSGSASFFLELNQNPWVVLRDCLFRVLDALHGQKSVPASTYYTLVVVSCVQVSWCAV